MLTNREVIAVEPGSAGRAGPPRARRGRQGGLDEAARRRPRAVILFNRGKAAAHISVSWAEAGPKEGASKLRDLWTHKEQPAPPDGYSATVPPHDVVLIRIYLSRPLNRTSARRATDPNGP